MNISDKIDEAMLTHYKEQSGKPRVIILNEEDVKELWEYNYYNLCESVETFYLYRGVEVIKGNVSGVKVY